MSTPTTSPQQGIDTTAEVSNIQKSAFDELLVAEYTPHTAWRMDYSINPDLYSTADSANGGTVVVDANRAKLSTSAAVNGIAHLETLRRVRYMPGIGGLARFTCVFATPKAQTQQIIGPGNGADGFYFGYDETDFGVLRRAAGVDYWTPRTDWNGTALTMDLNTSFGNIYQIRYQWLGYGAIKFYIFDALERALVLVHTIDYANTSASVHTLNPSFPLSAEIKNTGNNTDMVMYTPSAVAGLEGDAEKNHVVHPLHVPRAAVAATSIADTNNNHLLSVQNKTLLNAQDNRVSVRVRSIVFSRENLTAVRGCTFRVYKGATTAGARTYADVSTAHSPVSTSTTATTITGGTLVYQVTLPAGSSPFTVELDHDQVHLFPGDILTVAVQDTNANATDVSVTVAYEELF